MPRRHSRSSNIVGVALDGDVLRGAHLRDVVGRPRVVRTAEVGVDPDLTDHGRVVDHAALSDALRDLWKAGGFRTRNLAFGIDGRDATFRRFALPAQVGDDLVDAARYELAAYLPYALDEAITAVHEVGRNDSTVDVVVVAVRRRTAEDLATAAADAGLRLRDLTLAPTALALSVGGADSEDSTIVSVDAASTTIVVRRGGRATMTRVLSGGGGARSEQVADELEEALASVDQFRQGLGAHVELVEDPKVRRFRTVAEEVAAAIRFEESEQAGAATGGRVDLTGAFGSDPTLVDLVAAQVEVPVAVAQPPAFWPEDDSFAASATASGVALSAFDREPGIVHFDVPSLLARGRRRRELLAGVGVAALVALALGQAVVGARGDAERADDAALDAEFQAEVLAARAASLEELAILNEDVLDQRRITADAVAGEVWLPRILDEVAEAIPVETFLTGLTLRRPLDDVAGDEGDTSATFSGIALDQAGVAEWLLAVESLDLVDDVWLVQSTASVFGESETPVVAFVSEAHLTPAAVTPRSLGVESADVGEAS